MEPILTSQGITYKRNVLFICAIASLSLLDGVDISKAKVFELEIGNHLWSVGIALLIYHLISFMFEARQGFLKWNDVEMHRKPKVLEMFGVYPPLFPAKRNQPYEREELVKFEKKYIWRKFYYTSDNLPIMEGDQRKSTEVGPCASTSKYKLRKMQILHFMILDIFPIVIAVVFAGIAFFKHG